MWGIPENVNPFSGQIRPQELPSASPPQFTSPQTNWGTVNPFSGQLSPTPSNWSNFPQQAQQFSNSYLTPLSQDIGKIWQDYGQRVIDYSTKPMSTPWGSIPVPQSAITIPGLSALQMDPSQPLAETIGAIATSPFRKTSYESMPMEQKVPVELAAGFLIPFPGGKSSAITKAEKMMAKGYAAGHTLDDMAPIISKATGLADDVIRNLSNTLGVSAGERIQTPAQRANQMALRNAGATLAESPLRQIAVQAEPSSIAIGKSAAKRVRQAVTESEAAQRAEVVAQQATASPNAYANPAKRTVTTNPSSKGMTLGEHIEKQVMDINVVINKLGEEVQGHVTIKGIKGVNPLETVISLYKGASWKGFQAARDTYKKAVALLNGVSVDRLDDFLALKHNLTIFEMNPNRGKVLFTRPDGVTVSLDKLGMEVELHQLQTALGNKLAAVEQAGKVIVDHYNNLMQRLADTGRVNQRVADMLVQKYPWYNPIGYIDNIEKVILDPSNAPNFLKELADIAPAKLAKTPLRMLATETIKREKVIQQNIIRNAIAEAAAQSPRYAAQKSQGVEMATLEYWVNGVKQTVDAPKYLAETVENFFAVKDKAGFIKLLGVLQDITRAGMTRYNPAFYLPNFVIDTFTALMSQGVSPLTTAKYLAKNLFYIGRDNPVLELLNRAGAAGGNISVKGIEQDIAKGNIVLDGRKGWAKVVQILDDLNGAFETAPRAAAYETAIKRGFSSDQAALFARRVTIDFSRGGQAIQQLNTVFLFLNAGFQGAMIIPRAARTAPGRFAAGSAGFSVALSSLYAYNSQYEEYYDVPEYIRKGSILVMLPSDEIDKEGRKVPHYVRIIPSLREFSVFQATVVEAGDILKNKDPQNFGEFVTTTLALTSPLSNLIETGSSGGLYVPVPTQIGQTIANASMNYDPYRRVNIVSDYMKEQSSGQRSQEYNQYTSMLARRIGELSSILPGANQISPRIIDYFIQNLGGGGVQTLVGAYDAVDKLVTGLQSVDPRVAQLTLQLKGIQVNTDPQFVVTERQRLLNSLDTNTRQQVLNLENTPEMKIPIVSTIIGRFYNTFGGRQMEIATEKAKQSASPNEKPDEKFITDVTDLVRAVQRGSITPKEFDKELSLLKAYKSGASAQKYSGGIYSSEVNKFMPGGLPEPQKALDDYFNRMDAEVEKYGGNPTSAEWREINLSLDKYLKDNYSNKAIEYVKDNKLAWIKNLPSDVQTYLRNRELWIKTGSWFDNYNGTQKQYPSKVADTVPLNSKPFKIPKRQ